MKKFARTVLMLSLLTSLGTPVMGPAKANAGILFMTTGTVVGFALGVGMIIGGSSRRIIPLIVLDHAPDSRDLSGALQSRYPELDASLATEISRMITEKSSQAEEINGVKEVSLSETELKPVLDVLQLTQPELARLIVEDLK